MNLPKRLQNNFTGNRVEKGMKKLRFTGILLLLATVLSVAAIASADGITKRIKFARGRTSATVSGTVIRGDRDTYLLGANGGQTMSVRITSLENNAVFQIEAPDGSFLSGAGETDDARRWSGRLPEKGDYKIIVGGTRGNASYKVTVSIR
jgi:hypothetical protein